MTNDRAINPLESMAVDYPQERYQEAINMAIEARSEETPTINEKYQLSEETPINTPTDLIYRQDAIDAMVEYVADGYAESPNDFEGYMGIVKELPSAEPKTGKWVEVDCYGSEKHSVTDMRCSLCGKYASIVLPHRTRCVYNFCPNCGAKMIGENADNPKIGHEETTNVTMWRYECGARMEGGEEE